MGVKITRFKRFDKPPLYGFVDIEIPEWNMFINGCKVFNKNGGQWISLPSKEYENDQGDKKWAPLIGFHDEAVYKRFKQCLDAAWHEFINSQQPPQEEHPF